MMNASTLTPRVLGTAENAHRALLEHLLAGTDLTYQRWVALTLVAASDRVLESDILARLIAALKLNREEGRAVVADLAALCLVTPSDGYLRLTDRGRHLYTRIRAAIAEAIETAYADIPADDLAIAGRVLTEITARLNATLDELGWRP
jgi:DNA-binding MarR family transcriptional regulator